jgi:cobalt/nickel transport system permease protein
MTGDAAVRRPPPVPSQVALLAMLVFVAAVAVTPARSWPAFLGYALVLVLVARRLGVRARSVLPRMVVEVPFVVFALLLPFVATGETTEVMGLALSVDGLWGAWGVLAKATLGVVAAILLGLVWTPAQVIDGLQRLRLPDALLQIASFMVRYGEIVVAEVSRRRTAVRARGYQARHLGHAPVLARTLGATFVRTYERGERVHLAMVARGYTGTLPEPAEDAASDTYSLALVVTLVAVWCVALTAVVWQWPR